MSHAPTKNAAKPTPPRHRISAPGKWSQNSSLARCEICKTRQDVGCCFAEVRFLRPQNGRDFRPSKSARLSTCLFLLQTVLANEIRAPGLMKYDRGASLETARRRPPRQMPSTRTSLAKRVASAQPTSFARSAFVRAGGTRATLALSLLYSYALIISSLHN